MSEHRPNIEIIPASEYDALVDERLPADALVEDQPATLLVRKNDLAKDAFRMAIIANHLQREASRLAFQTIILDQDFRPALKPIKSTMESDNLWRGGLQITARGRTVRTPQGFIIPYEDAADRALLEAFEMLGAGR